MRETVGSQPQGRQAARRRTLLRALAALPLLGLLTLGIAWLRAAIDPREPSRSVGSVAHGSLEHGRSLPPWGPGFRSYAVLGTALGRQSLDGRVREALEEALAARAAAEPGRTFVVGETGWPSGGRFRPHRSHQSGRSVDLFVPLRDALGRPAEVPTWPWDGFGYGVHFDNQGRRGAEQIDFECLAALLRELDVRARAQGLRIERIILEPELQPLLLQTPSGKQLGPLADALMKSRAWIRHDQHVHVDFAG